VVLRGIAKLLQHGVTVSRLKGALQGLRRRHPEFSPTSVPAALLVTDGISVYFRDSEQVVEELLPHYGADCPVAVVAHASQPDERVVRGTLDDIAGRVRDAGISRAAMIFVGRVLAAENYPDSFLYSATRERANQPESL
jgi:precorrin-4/cobalt-precorrin-4 C11-methyltransferase